VDTTINALNEQRELANEIAEAIANPVNLDIDEVCSSLRAYYSSIITVFKDELKQELEDLQQDELNERLNQADHVPVHQPPTAKKEDGKSSGYPILMCLSGF
jgi:charged multivesicular body protein 4